MSIKLSLLALVHAKPSYGYELKSEFEARTGGTWPLNIGQVYTTLDRLERDGLVVNDGDDGEGHVVYRITTEGAAEVRDWFTSPAIASNPPRNELAIKIALATTLPDIDVQALLQTQRRASVQTLQNCTHSKRAADPDDIAWMLVLESLIFAAEAEVRWIDHCESALVRAAARTQRNETTRPASSVARSRS